MAVKKKKPINYQHFTVVGLQFRLTKQARSLLSTKIPFRVVFKREPKNIADENAIAVFIAEGEMLEGQHIGYLRRGVSEVLAPKLDSGEAVLSSYGVVDSMRVDEGTAEVKMAISKGK